MNCIEILVSKTFVNSYVNYLIALINISNIFFFIFNMMELQLLNSKMVLLLYNLLCQNDVKENIGTIEHWNDRTVTKTTSSPLKRTVRLLETLEALSCVHTKSSWNTIVCCYNNDSKSRLHPSHGSSSSLNFDPKFSTVL